MTMADDLKNLAGRASNAGFEFAALTSNARAMVEDIISLRDKAGHEDDKSEGFANALDALQEAETATLNVARAAEETFAKLIGVIDG